MYGKKRIIVVVYAMVPFGKSSNFFVQGDFQFNAGQGVLNWKEEKVPLVACS